MQHEKFIEMSDLGNERNQSQSYYERFVNFFVENELLDENETSELIDRIESFIQQEVGEMIEERHDQFIDFNIEQ